MTQTSSENLKVAVVEFRRIADRSASPERALVHLSQVLARFPQMEIDGVTWSVGRLADRGGPRTAAPAAPAAKPEPAQRYGGDRRGLRARQRHAAHRLPRHHRRRCERFAAALAGSGYQLVERKLPFDVTSEGTLTGDIGATDTGEAPRFTIVFARSLP